MKILCATDLLPKSEAAIERAGLLSNQLNAELSLLHVVAPDKSQHDLERTLLSAVARTRSRAKPLLWKTDRTAGVAVRVGTPARIIVETAAKLDAGLLVLGPHRKRPLRDALEGTIAEKALATRKHPVLIVRDAAPKPYRRVLLALDLSDASVSALRAAEAVVLKPETEAVVVHAHNPPYLGMVSYADAAQDGGARYMRAWKRDAAHAVRGFLASESEDAERYHIHVEQMQATPGILQAMRRHSPDLLVMGTRGAGRLRRALVGSVANRVLHETSCDVLIVPEGSFGAARGMEVKRDPALRTRRPQATVDRALNSRAWRRDTSISGPSRNWTCSRPPSPSSTDSMKSRFTTWLRLARK
jgi:universal stress protein E